MWGGTRYVGHAGAQTPFGPLRPSPSLPEIVVNKKFPRSGGDVDKALIKSIVGLQKKVCPIPSVYRRSTEEGGAPFHRLPSAVRRKRSNAQTLGTARQWLQNRSSLGSKGRRVEGSRGIDGRRV